MGRGPARVMDEDLRGYLDYERRISERLSSRIVPFRYGVAFLDESFPLRYDSSFLELFEPAPRVTFEDLATEADRALAGFSHREVLVNHEVDGERLEPAFSSAGWSVERDALMVRRREPDRPAPLPVEELGFAEAEPLIREVNRRFHPDEAVVEQLTGYGAKLERLAGARWFVARVDGRPAGSCELYVVEGVAQVENVNTLEEYRGRGVARSVISAAIDAARAGGAARIFIITDVHDWPKDLYAKLGFDPVGTLWQFTLAPIPPDAP